MKVKSWMQKAVHTLTEEDSLREAINLTRKHHIRHIPIVGNDQTLLGIVSDRDIKRFTPSILNQTDIEGLERALEETPLTRIMTRDPLTITPSAHIREAVAIFCDNKIGALPVVVDQKLVGILSEVDMLRAFHQALSKRQAKIS